MPVTEITELHEGRRLEISDDFVIRAYRHLRVYCDSPFDGPVTVRNGGIPVEYVDVHPESNQLLCRSVEVTALAEGFSESLAVYDVMVTYSNQPITAGGLEGDSGTQVVEFNNPLNRPVEIEFVRAAEGTKPVGHAPGGFIRLAAHPSLADEELTPQVIRNSADAPLSVDVRDIKSTLRVVRNEASFFHANATPYVGKLNGITFAGFGRRTVLCTGIAASFAIEGQVPYWRVSYTFDIGQHDPELSSFGVDHYFYASDSVPPDASTPGSGTKSLKRITVNGVDVSDPRPLDAWGRAIDATFLANAFSDTYIDRRRWLIYEEADFNELNLPV